MPPLTKGDCERATITGQGSPEAITEDTPGDSSKTRRLLLWRGAMHSKNQSPLARSSFLPIDVEIELDLEGDFEKTEKRIPWLSTKGQRPIPDTLVHFKYFITKYKL